MSEPKVNKLSLKGYPIVFDIHLPIRFFFNEDGSFDGIEVYVENASERDQKLSEELCKKLAESCGIKFFYEASKDKDA